ncbi:hypothetical protein [Desulfosediminicola ganghwensis]|uniref:hypothetical protein n=1 Tax=Desulfosediminicola ganghwensis TaxID=2569540 RepID=UPI0012948048|nr:hypothetical protein [Desulfosediminicola ganghwensis]
MQTIWLGVFIQQSAGNTIIRRFFHGMFRQPDDEEAIESAAYGKVGLKSLSF